MKNSQPQLKTTDLYESKLKDQNFTDLSEVFLQTPPPFILRGPIYIILFILLAAVIYATITSVNMKVSGYMTIKGEEYIVQSPVNGLVNVIYQLDNNNVLVNDKLLSLYSQTAFTKETSLDISDQKKEKLVKKYQWLLQFKKNIDNLVLEYTNKENSFDVSIPKLKYSISVDIDNIHLSHSDSLQFSNNGDFGLKYLNLKQNIKLLWQDYKRAKKSTEDLKVTYFENKELLKKSFISRQEYLISEQSYNQKKGELESIITNFKVSILSTYQEIYNGIEDVALQLSALDQEIESLKYILSGIEIVGNSFLLRNKYSGMVTDIYVKTNQMVSEGSPLIRIIRDDFPLVGIVNIPTSQVSQIVTGQEVAIRYDAFPFQIYGVQKGEVISISSDVKLVEGFGYTYEVTIALQDNPKIKIKPGEGGIAEIKTGKKKIIEIALAPVAKIFAYLRGEN